MDIWTEQSTRVKITSERKKRGGGLAGEGEGILLAAELLKPSLANFTGSVSVLTLLHGPGGSAAPERCSRLVWRLQHLHSTILPEQGGPECWAHH